VLYTHPNTLGQGPVRPQIEGFPVHPATTYEMLGDFVIFAVALWLVFRFMGNLYTYWFVVAGYSALRLGLQFLRLDQHVLFGGLQQSQVIGIIGLVVSAYWAVRHLWQRRVAARAPAPAAPRPPRQR